MCLLIACALALAPQDPAPLDVEKLHAELHGKVAALKSVSAKLSLEAVDDKGVSEVRYSAPFHCRQAEGWLFFEMKEAKSGGTTSMMFERFTTIRHWTKDGPGQVVDMTAAMTALMRSLWRAGQEECRVMGEPDPYPTFEAYEAHLKPLILVQVDPAEPGSPEAAGLHISMGKSSRGGASWLNSIRGPSRVTAGADEVQVVETEPSRTIAIDRRTGWLRSITLRTPRGNRRLVFSEVVTDDPSPTVKRPEKWTVRPPTIRNELAFTLPGLRMNVEWDLDRFLRSWDRAGGEGRIEALRGYFARTAAELKTFIRCQVQLFWAADYVKQATGRGLSLDDLEGEIEDHAGALDATLKRGEKEYGPLLDERLSTMRKDLESFVDKSTAGNDEARRQLKLRLQEGFQLDRVNKVRPTFPALAAERLLMDAIVTAREQEKK